VVLALALRLYRLDARSLWLDEILTSQPAHLRNPGDVIAWSQAAINQMPLFYMFTWFLGHWSDGAVMLRLPATIAGTILAPVVFLLGRSLFGTLVGLVAGLLVAIMPFAVWYSQEARSYTLLMLLTTLQMYFALAAVKRGGVLTWLGLASLTILNLYTHYVAIFATVAVASFVGLFLLIELLRGAPLRVKSASVVSIALAAGAAISAVAVVRSHRAVAIAAAGAAVVLVAVPLVVLATRQPAAEKVRRIAPALLAGGIVAVAYAPWLTSLRILLRRPDQTLGQINVGHAPNIGDLANTLNGLGLTGIVLAFLCLGLGATAVWAFRGKAVEAGLLLAWICVPLGILLITAGRAILAVDVRYIAFLFPAAMIAVGAGVQAAAIGLPILATRLRLSPTPRTRWTTPAVGLVAVALLLVQVLPALAASYGQSKDDYRHVARHITAASAPGSIVLTVGNYSDWTVICLGYYFREFSSPVTVVDARQADSALVQQLTYSSGTVWGVVIFASNDQLALMASSGSEKVDFVDVTGNIRVVRAADANLSPVQQAWTLLRWELPLEPALKDSLSRMVSPPTQ